MKQSRFSGSSSRENSNASGSESNQRALNHLFLLFQRAASRVRMLDAFLEQECAAGRIQLFWQTVSAKDQPKHFVVHSHCHQKTLDGGRWTHKLLQRIPGAVVSNTNAGCCDMAGSFSYEKEHAELSIKIAQQRLLPALDQTPSAGIVVSYGFSCRHQIADLTRHRPIHAAEALRMFLQSTVANIISEGPIK